MKRKTVFQDLKGNRLLKSDNVFIKAGGVSFLAKWNANHPKFEEGKFTDLIRSIKPTFCRKCGSQNIKLVQKNGCNLPRWLCLREGKTFYVLDGSVFDRSKLPFDEWIEYLTVIRKLSFFIHRIRNF